MISVRKLALALLFLFAAVLAGCKSRAATRSPSFQRHDARVLAGGPRRGGEGGERGERRDRLEGPHQGGRPQGAGGRGRDVHRAGRVRDRSRAAERQGPREPGEGRGGGEDPGRGLRLGSPGRPSHELRRDGQLRGRQARGEHMAKALGDNKTVAVLRYQEGSASTANRERGFLDARRRTPRSKS